MSALVAAGITPEGLDALKSHRVPIIPVTILASASINASDAIVVELVEADPHPRRFPPGADAAAAYPAAVVKLAQIRRERRL